MPSSIELHFDGDLVKDHKVALRTLGKSLTHLQSAIDRAHLDVKYGNVWKHARLKIEDYENLEFIVDYPQPGGFRIKAVAGEVFAQADAVTQRVWNAIRAVVDAPLEEGIAEAERLSQQVNTRREQVAHQIFVPKDYDQLLLNPDPGMIRAYSDRSIGKEIDQIVSVIRNRGAGDSNLEFNLTVDGNNFQQGFDRVSASKFHKVVSRRELGEPVIYSGNLRSLDRGGKYARPSGRFTLAPKNRDIILHIASDDDFAKLTPYLDGNQIQILGAPVIEFGAYDPQGGDAYFVEVLPDVA